MLLSCDICHREYVGSKKSPDDAFICSKCQLKKYEMQKNTKLGIHPLLEKKIVTHKEATLNVSPSNEHNKNNDLALSNTQIIPKISGYEIAYQVGRGAMGSVYKARQIKTGRWVAIKVLSKDLAQRADLTARFEREAYALKSLANPHVVTIIDAGHEGDLHYFVMEFIDGITLRARITNAPIAFHDASLIIMQILQGLKAAHKHGIIHRDLKPENVLLEFDGHNVIDAPKRVVLVDFGLVGIGAFVFDPHPNLTRSKVTMGTVNYMAPEQHIDAKRVDQRSDIYSSGVILFEMLTGELPLGRYRLPYERGLKVPEKLDQILTKALSRDLHERYQSVRDFEDDLLDAIHDYDKSLVESTRILVSNNLSATNIWLLLKYTFYSWRYGLLFIIAALFFWLGIRFSQ